VNGYGAPAGGGPQAARASWNPGTTVLGEFLVERHLGRGGFGQVELVQSRRSGQRYAVKRILVSDTVAQARLLLEAQRWINLPDHPHVAACHFVRTVDHELAVFAEYLDGGSLDDWLRTDRLRDGGEASALARVLDIAVQSAWGLHAAHLMGLLHLDMKPANVLLTVDGVAKVADFGLAAARERPAVEVLQQEMLLDYIARGADDAAKGGWWRRRRQRRSPEQVAGEREIIRNVLREQIAAAQADQTLVVEGSEGLSAPYASPEQAEGRALTRASDIWSWGVTVLEMFTGERTWPSGTLAPAVLDGLGTQPPMTGALTMPAGVVDLLRACFQDDPAARPASLGETADRLLDLYRQACGRPLGRERPPEVSITDVIQNRHQRPLDTGTAWGDPRSWLQFAYQAAGQDKLQAVPYWPSGVGTKRAQTLEDLRALSEAQRVLEGVARPTSELLLGLAELRADLGNVRISLGDAAGAIGDYEAGARLLDTIPGEHAKFTLAGVLTDLAILLRGQGRRDDAVAACDRAIQLCRNLDGDRLAKRALGNALLAKANSMGSSADIGLYDEALTLYQGVGDDVDEVKALAAKASALGFRGREGEAAPVWKRADVTLQRLIDKGHPELLGLKATTLLNRAMAASSVPDQLRYAQAAIGIYSPLVTEQGHHELAGDLGRALFFAGRGHEHADRPQAAVDRYRTARAFLEDAVVRDGRFDLADELANCYDHEATLIRELGDPAGAVRVARRAVDMWLRLAHLEGEGTWGGQLAEARLKLASSLGAAGDQQAALAELEEVMRLSQLGDGPGDGGMRLARAYQERGSIWRNSGRIDAAIKDYQAALRMVGEGSQPQELSARALILQNLSNAIEDARDYRMALDVIDAAIALLQTLADRGEEQISNLVDVYHNRVNKLVKLGSYAAARDSGERTLSLYRQLVAEGRTDLVIELARLQFAHGMTLERLFDLQGAISAHQTARGLFAGVTSMDPELRDGILRDLDGRLARLEQLLTSGPKDVST
jgi:serine/threonine protein kinase/tetratricopeptide (TPR) repeat protein